MGSDNIDTAVTGGYIPPPKVPGPGDPEYDALIYSKEQDQLRASQGRASTYLTQQGLGSSGVFARTLLGS